MTKNQRFEYMSGIPAVFPFDYDAVIGVERAVREEDQPALPETGSVVLCLGDILTVTEDFELEHAHLLPLEVPADRTENGSKAAPSLDKAEKTPSKGSKAPAVPEQAPAVQQPEGAQEPEKEPESVDALAVGDRVEFHDDEFGQRVGLITELDGEGFATVACEPDGDEALVPTSGLERIPHSDSAPAEADTTIKEG